MSKIRLDQKEYELCPEYQGVAVCVDATEPEIRDTDFGRKESIRFVFELPIEMDDGKRFTVRSAPLNTTLHPKASLRKFLKQMLGRDLTDKELKDGFDPEEMVGLNFSISVVHEENDEGKVFDQIALCRPWKGDAMEASGDYIRVRDRKDKKGHKRPRDEDEDDDGESSPKKESSFRRAEQAPKKQGPTDHGLVKVHIGKHKGLELRDLTREAIEKLIENWLEKVFPKIEKPLADDRRLAAALEAYKKKFSGEAEEEEEDDVPMEDY